MSIQKEAFTNYGPIIEDDWPIMVEADTSGRNGPRLSRRWHRRNATRRWCSACSPPPSPKLFLGGALTLSSPDVAERLRPPTHYEKDHLGAVFGHFEGVLV